MSTVLLRSAGGGAWGAGAQDPIAVVEEAFALGAEAHVPGVEVGDVGAAGCCDEGPVTHVVLVSEVGVSGV